MRLVNGVRADSLALSDRAIQFGDGVFRTLKLEQDELPLWLRHYRKLAADCHALGIVPPGADEILGDIHALLAQERPQSASIKIIITRGESARGYVVPPGIRPNRIVQFAPLPNYPQALYSEGAKLRLCRIRAGWQPALAGVKHLNRLENVLARQEWHDPSILEGLLLDRDDHVVEGVASNILARFGDTLRTPQLDGCGVAGVMREVAFDAARLLGWPVEENTMTLQTLLQADQVWVSNSLMGLMPVAQLEGTHWTVPPDCPLQAEVKRLCRQETLGCHKTSPAGR